MLEYGDKRLFNEAKVHRFGLVDGIASVGQDRSLGCGHLTGCVLREGKVDAFVVRDRGANEKGGAISGEEKSPSILFTCYFLRRVEIRGSWCHVDSFLKHRPVFKEESTHLILDIFVAWSFTSLLQAASDMGEKFH